jgi:hypothetical protein
MTPKDKDRIDRRKQLIAAAQVQRLVEKKKITLAPVSMWLKIVKERETERAAD